jgi:hypothetical protein
MYQRAQRHNKVEFKSLMAFAQRIADENPMALVDYVRLLARPLQSELMLDPAVKGQIQDVPDVDPMNFFWDSQSDYFSQLRARRRRSDIQVHLGRDIVLPCPWEPGRLARSMTAIGPGRKWGRWKEDPLNHGLILWLPWGLSFVGGGNHSITAGIIGATGVLKPREIYDMSGIFRKVKCDGLIYTSTDGSTKIADVTDARIAAIFETGRLMHKHKVSAW